MRILFLSSDRFPPFRVDVSVLFGRELVSRGHRIDWILQSQADCGRRYGTRWGGGEAIVGPTDNGSGRWARFRKHWLDIINDLQGLARLKSGDYDAIQVKDKFVSAVAGLVAARRAHLPFVYWLSFPFPEQSLHNAKTGSARYPVIYRIRGWTLSLLLYRLILPRADHIFVQSEQMRLDLAERGAELERMTAVPMGVDLDSIPRRPGDERSIRSSTRTPTIAYLGTLNRARRLEFLIRVLHRVLQRRPGTRLLMVGDADCPSDRQALMGEAARLQIEDKVSITGFLPRTQALERIMEADVCLSPFFPSFALLSTSPTKLVEYMALGKPVVASDHPEQRLVLESSGGGLCVAWDENDFAEAILQLLCDPPRASEMGRRGREYVEAHRSYARIAELVESQYMRLLGGQREGDNNGRTDAEPRCRTTR